MSPHPKKPAPGLEAYRKKRSPGGTPEPMGGSGGERPGLFVVQQHAARRLHWDLRLEMGGVLRSWAVPKGPSLAPLEKRLAVLTEDHPLEYADFEGLIPEGHYGAGAMIVWDRGLWIPHLDPEEGMDQGKQLFDLRGYKLRGLWTLVRTKREPKEWLLIKKPDAWATGEDAGELSGASVLSGLTVEELREGTDKADAIRRELARLGAPRRRVDPSKLKPMLAEAEPKPFSKPGWLFELKYDGYRVLAAKELAPGGGARAGVRLFYRSGREATATFPELTRALAALPFASLIADGEVVVLDDEARPSFQLLQRRGLLTRRADVERAAVQLPATLFCFDLLAFEDFDLRPLPLVRRKELLSRVLPAAGPLRYADHVEAKGLELYAAVAEMGLEGLMAKRADSPYRPGRSPAWLKIRADRTGDFVVVGFTRPEGSRPGFGALHLAAFRDGSLVYAGRAGTGFTVAQLREIHRQLAGERRPSPAASGELPTGPEHVWVEPRHVVEVRYAEVTEAGQLRLPVFLRLRPDKRPEECGWEGGGGHAAEEPPAEPAPAAPAGAKPEPRLTKLDKVFWPEEGYTKGDLLAYYRAVAPRLLPYLRDRPLVLDRYPDGIAGKSFFQKNAPDFAPDWVRTEGVWSEPEGDGQGGEETRYFLCDDVETLLYLVNLGAIPLHVWSSRISSLERPDWAILDLDAKDAPLASVIAVARAIHRLASEVGLPTFIKTSGASGLHVLLPTGGLLTHDQARQLAEVLARVVASEHPELASVARLPASRKGLVYLDFLQNGRGKLLVAPFSVRPLPGAPASTPLAWREVTARLDPKAFTIKTVPVRLKRQKEDPLAGVLEARPDLGDALERLSARV